MMKLALLVYVRLCLFKCYSKPCYLFEASSRQVTFYVAPSPGSYLRLADFCFKEIATLIGDVENYLVLSPLVCCEQFPYSKLAGIWKLSATPVLQLIPYTALPIRFAYLFFGMLASFFYCWKPSVLTRRSTCCDQRLRGTTWGMANSCCCELP